MRSLEGIHASVGVGVIVSLWEQQTENSLFPNPYIKYWNFNHKVAIDTLQVGYVAKLLVDILYLIHYRGPGAVTVHVLRTEGPRGLYHGFTSNIARNFPGEMVFFATYEQCRSLIKQPGQVKDDIGMKYYQYDLL